MKFRGRTPCGPTVVIIREGRSKEVWSRSLDNPPRFGSPRTRRASAGAAPTGPSCLSLRASALRFLDEFLGSPWAMKWLRPAALNDRCVTVTARFDGRWVPFTTVAPVAAKHRKTARGTVRSHGGRVQTSEGVAELPAGVARLRPRRQRPLAAAKVLRPGLLTGASS